MSLSFGVIQNQQNDAQTVRAASTALLTIDSDDRFTSYTAKRAAAPGSYNYSPYDFQINKASSLMNGFITRLAVSEINFPWCVPNINPKTSKIQVGYASIISGPYTYYTIEVPYGFYTPVDLASAIQGLIQAQGGSLATFIFEYDTDNVTPQFNYNSGSAGVFVNFAPMPYNTTRYPYNDNTRQLFDVLGFSNVNTTVGTNNVNVYGGVSYAQAIHYVDIVCSQLVLNQPLKDATSQPIGRDALCRLYIVDADGVFASDVGSYIFPGNKPATVYRDFTTPKQIQWTPNQPITAGLTFQVYDDQGDNLLDSMPPGVMPADWNITLLVSES